MSDHLKVAKKMLLTIAPSKHRHEVFKDFVTVTALTLRNSIRDPEWQERENRYLSIVKDYSRDELDSFAKVFSHITIAMEQEPSDVLGRLYMEMELGSSELGQFFTPYSIAELMVAMSLDGIEATVEEHGYATVYEPACGAGAFLVAATQEMRRRGVNYQQQIHVTAEDISELAVMMAYVHLSLLHVPAVVYHRDTLTQETFAAWPTPAHVVGLWSIRLRGEAKDAPVPSAGRFRAPAVVDTSDTENERTVS